VRGAAGPLLSPLRRKPGYDAAIPRGLRKPHPNRRRAARRSGDRLYPASELWYRRNRPTLSEGFHANPGGFNSRFDRVPVSDLREQIGAPAVSIRGVNY